MELPIAANDNVRSDFYVYAWKRPSGVVFYIGKGCRYRDRSPKSTNQIFTRIVAKIERNGGKPLVVRLHDGLTETEAHRLECLEIAKHGRINLKTGTLANLTDGGEGNSGWVVPQETRAKIGAANKGLVRSPEQLARRIAKGRIVSDATRRKMSASQIGRKHGPETIAKMSANNAMQRPEIVAKVVAAVSGVPKSLEHRANLSAAAKNRSVTHTENLGRANRMRPPASGYKGVSWNTAAGKWKVAIRIGDKRPFLGYFTDPLQAANAYDQAAIAAWGHGNCYLNLANDNVQALAA